MISIHAQDGRRLRGAGRRLAPWALVVVVASLVALVLGFRVSLSPLALHPKEVVFSAAEAQVFVDTASPSGLLTDQQDAGVEGRYMTGDPDEAQLLSQWVQGLGPLEQMAAAAGSPGKVVYSSGPYSEYLPDTEPHFPHLAKNLRLLVDVDGVRPMITLYGQAPTEKAATAIVDSARDQIIAHVAAEAASDHDPRLVPPFAVRSLGATTAGVVNPSGMWQLLAVSFGIVFLTGAMLILLVRSRSRRRVLTRLRERAAARDRPAPDDAPDDGQDLWPHTKRFLPWSIAVFILMIFLLPMDAIFASNTGATPLSPTPDRIMLLIMGVAWIASLCGHRRRRGLTRVRFTRIHAVLALFIGIVFLSVGLSGHELALYGEVMPSVKKLFVVLTWTAFFMIAASTIRPGEVRPLLKLVVAAGVLCAIGTCIERQTRVNLFYLPWRTLHVPLTLPAEMDVVDDIGRLGVVGPTSQPLELATMLALVICPAIAFAFDARSRRERWMWLVATMIVMAGALATSRKTSIVAPVIGLMVLTAYRPRQMLRGLVLAILPAIVVAHLLAPGQLGSVLSELEPAHATKVNTDQVRVKRWDAVRPDVMSHLVIGDGYSSYDPIMFRYLDNEYLGLLITAGALGMCGLLALFAAMFTLSHPLIRGPDRERANTALAIQAMVAMTMVCCALFDTLAFDHVTYLLFLLGGMLVAMHRPVRPGARVPTSPRRTAGTLTRGDPRRPRVATGDRAPAIV